MPVSTKFMILNSCSSYIRITMMFLMHGRAVMKLLQCNLLLVRLWERLMIMKALKSLFTENVFFKTQSEQLTEVISLSGSQ